MASLSHLRIEWSLPGVLAGLGEREVASCFGGDVERSAVERLRIGVIARHFAAYLPPTGALIEDGVTSRRGGDSDTADVRWRLSKKLLRMSK